MRVKASKRPTTMDATETALYDFFTELLNARRVSDEVFKAFKEKIGGEKPLMELVGLVGSRALAYLAISTNGFFFSARTTRSSAIV